MLTLRPVTKAEAITLFDGSQKKLAEALGITSSAISQWGDIVPRRWELEIKEIKGRELAAARAGAEARA